MALPAFAEKPAMSTRWKPSVTVAAVIERAGRFLIIEEHTPAGLRLNQPAGHLDPGESLLQAVVRETLEETAHDFIPTALVGFYLARFRPAGAAADVTYLRVTFCGEAGMDHGTALDDGIVRVLWLTYDELAACPERHRSELVLRCVDDYRSGQRAPLSLLVTQDTVLAH